MCVFCSIIAKEAPASIIHEDDRCLAFMNIRPINPGEFMVIPKKHIDHFTDLPDVLASHVLLVAQRLGRNLLREFKPLRIGYVVHGFGVPHAHLNVVPQHSTTDIISGKLVVPTEDGFKFSMEHIRSPDRAELDEHARRLA